MLGHSSHPTDDHCQDRSTDHSSASRRLSSLCPIVLTALTVAVSWLREEINWHVIVHDVYAYIAYGAMSEGKLNDCENVFKIRYMYDYD